MSKLSSPSIPASARTDLPTVMQLADVVEVELNGPLPEGLTSAHPHVLIVVLLCARPIGMALVSADDASSGARLAAGIWSALEPHIRAEAAEHGITVTNLSAGGLPHPSCAIVLERADVARSGPPVSVLICTHERAEPLEMCLESVLKLDYHDFEIVVVDNNPRTDATREVCERLAADRPPGGPALRYVVESRAGVSYARNRGLREAAHELIAFIDDDERAHRNWTTELVREFIADESVGVISGLVRPAELDTRAQVIYEQFGGHSKGRGFTRVRFDSDYLKTSQPAMYPLPPFGVGANMAFRRAAILGVGGFDEALGAGTSVGGGEDTLAFSNLLLAGWTMLYVPAAMTAHFHRRSMADLEEQLTGYGLGLGAFYVALLLSDPRRLWKLIRLLPGAISDIRDPNSARNAGANAGGDQNPGLSPVKMIIGSCRYMGMRLRNALRRDARAAGGEQWPG